MWTTPPSLENVEMIFATADTMDDFCSYGVFAWDVNDCLYLIECGEVPYIELTAEKREMVNEQLRQENKPPVITLEDILNKEYLVNEDGIGIKPTFMVIDQGGHKIEEVRHFAKANHQVIMQKGTSMSSMNWRPSENQQKLILTNEKYWRSTFIYYLYSQKNTHENFLFFYPEISEEHLAEIRDVHPDNSSKWGSEPANWVSKTR